MRLNALTRNGPGRARPVVGATTTNAARLADPFHQFCPVTALSLLLNLDGWFWKDGAETCYFGKVHYHYTVSITQTLTLSPKVATVACCNAEQLTGCDQIAMGVL